VLSSYARGRSILEQQSKVEIYCIFVLNINKYMNACLYCSKSFTKKSGTTGKYCSLSCSSLHFGEKRRLLTISRYEATPKICKRCGTTIPFDKRKSNMFCSSSCAAIFNNAKKDWTTIKTGPVPKPKLPKLSRKKRSTTLIDADGPHTRVYLCSCKISGKQWYSPTIKTIHPLTIETKKLYSYQCRFTFNIAKYPDWFDYASALIKQYGWYSAANRGNNLSGCSRDHLYSVSDGYKNNIDPAIMSHPANCNIVPHRRNQNKHKHSSITLNELLERIKLFDQQYLELATGIQPA